MFWGACTFVDFPGRPRRGGRRRGLPRAHQRPAAHSTSSLGRSQEETSCSGAADSVMLGYANLAKAWNVAHSGGEHVDPTLGMMAQVRSASQNKQIAGRAVLAGSGCGSGGQPGNMGGGSQRPLMMRHAEGQCRWLGQIAVQAFRRTPCFEEGNGFDNLEMVFGAFGCGFGAGAWR